MIRCTNVVEQAQEIHDEVSARWAEVVKSGDFILGEEVDIFEGWFSERCGGAHAISLNSGADALKVSLLAMGVGTGDEVITCSNTFIATVGAIRAVGATPILADVGPDELMTADLISAVTTWRTKVVIPVHLRGRPVHIAPIKKFCDSRGIGILEDCAQAIGTTDCGKQVGSDGGAAAFSLHPLKTLGGFGDGGVLVTRNNDIASFARRYRNHGMERRGNSLLFGDNSRLDSLQAAVLNVKTKYLDVWLKRRLEIANFYNASLLNSLIGPDLGVALAGNSYYHYVVKAERRDALIAHLAKNNVETAIHYPLPIHHQRAWTDSESHIDLPVTCYLAQRILTVPCHQHLTDAEVEHVATCIKKF
jgi:aminotransferase EvaB